MKSRLVVKDNALIEASFNLTLIEQRLMLLAIVEARELPVLTPLVPVEIKVTSYMELYGVAASTAYETLWDASKTLKKREFSYLDRYKGSNALSIAGWVNKITYVDEKGLIVLYFSEEVISMISRLQDQFTRYHLEQVADFKSKYSIRLYELIIKWLSVGKTEKFEIEALRGKLGLEENKYKTMSLFKANVIDKAVLEISTKTDIEVEYEQFKEGRSVSHLLFRITPKLIKTVESKTRKPKFELNENQVHLFAHRLASDPLFGNEFAEAGESLEEFEIRLKSQLTDPRLKAIYAPHLIRLGYREKQS